jgi:hypothetical protein
MLAERHDDEDEGDGDINGNASGSVGAGDAGCNGLRCSDSRCGVRLNSDCVGFSEGGNGIGVIAIGVRSGFGASLGSGASASASVGSGICVDVGDGIPVATEARVGVDVAATVGVGVRVDVSAGIEVRIGVDVTVADNGVVSAIRGISPDVTLDASCTTEGSAGPAAASPDLSSEPVIDAAANG